VRYVLSILRIIVRDELGATKTGVPGGVFKGKSDTSVEITRKPTEYFTLLEFGPRL
jgi:hypothetical protein